MRRFCSFVFIILCVALFPATTAIAQVGDTAIFGLDIFETDEEKQTFRAISDGREVDFLQLFMLTGGEATSKNFQSRIDAFADKAGLKQVLKSRELKKIYKDIHDAFLVRYVENPAFGALFESGNYNCATATALYALVLDRLSISYRILETPRHVYIVAAPETHHVVFETTLPGTRAYQISEKNKGRYLEYLYKNKLIGAEEWGSADRNALFEKYFYSDSSINKQQLAGLLYYNQAVAALEQEDFNAAYGNFEKAYFLYPTQKLKYFISLSLANIILKDGNAESEKAYRLFLRFAVVTDEDIVRPTLVDYMDKVTQRLLFRKPDLKLYLHIYKSISGQLTDTLLRNDLRYMHYYHTAHYYSIKANYDSSLVYLDSVYALNQEDLMVHELITSTYMERLQGNTDESVGVKMLKTAFLRYPFIDRRGKLGEYYNFCLSQSTAKCFQKNNKAEGDRFLDEIRQLITTDPEFSKRSEPYFVNAFLEGYYYFIRLKDYRQAKAFISGAKKYYPDNEEIKKRVAGIDQILQFH